MKFIKVINGHTSNGNTHQATAGGKTAPANSSSSMPGTSDQKETTARQTMDPRPGGGCIPVSGFDR
ncbi:MAG: hypothetical protein RBT63_10280 [Bdellovibrionales bacterium]|nr:hypothetical protein [Bdellovibrionales bacterium]